MNKDMIQNIFIGILLGGVILLAGGVYYLAMQVQTATQGIGRIELSVTESMQKANAAMIKADESAMKVEKGMMKADDVRRERGETDCSSLGAGWALYQSNTVDVSFCMNSAWGPVREELENFVPEAANGRIYRVVFGEASPPGGPIISYSSQDFRRLLDSDVPSLNWDMIDFSKSEETLAADFAAFEGVVLGEGEYILVTKTTVAGKPALVVESNFKGPLADFSVHSVHWYIPEAISNGTYNLEIYSGARIRSDAQLLVDNLKIN